MANRKINAQEYDAGCIAVIGMAGRFPGAADVEAFWQQLKEGKEGIVTLSEAELLEEGIEPVLFKAPNYVKAAAPLENIDRFDAAFFNIPPAEAAVIDPQQRIFLEGAWAAFENAGYVPDEYPGRVGVFAGSNMSTYLLQRLNLIGGVHRLADNVEFLVGNDKDYLSTRVSYKLNLRGPSINVSTACSTSLVAVTLACQSLIDYTCDMALAGGVSVSVPQRSGYLYRDINGGLSADGHCRAFDKSATGCVFGNGMGIVVLKRMADAIADQDNILAVIKGWAINNDGASKAGFMSPGVNGHRDAVVESITMAGIDAGTLDYIEAHGTGTALGDPIEITALSNAFRHWTQKKHFCAIGSVKTNIGHTVSAAGITGMIKTVLALHHRQIPPSLFFKEPNPGINFNDSPFYVPTQLQSWPDNDHPARAGVSALGVGGTNVHVTLEEVAAPANAVPATTDWNVIPLSAKTPTALARMKENLARFLADNPATEMNNLAYTLQTGRKAFPERELYVCQTVEELIQQLKRPVTSPLLTNTYNGVEKGLVFMFPGASDSVLVLGQELYKTEKVFKYWMDKAVSTIQAFTGENIYKELLTLHKKGKKEALAVKLKEAAVGLPFLFAFQYALVKQLDSWDIKPDEMIGHSSGEFTVACLAGVISFETTIELIIKRSRLFERLEPGGMLNVNLSEEELQPWLNNDLCVSAVNAPDYCMVCGKAGAVDQLEHKLNKSNIACLRLPIAGAPHSFMLEPVAKDLEQLYQSLVFHAPAQHYVSSLTGKRITAAEATSPDYWLRHTLWKVRFSDAAEHLLRTNNKLIFVEIGSGNVLTPLVRKHKGYQGNPSATITLLPVGAKQPSERKALFKAVGQLWLYGCKINWGLLHGKSLRQKIQLPGYSFEPTIHWLAPAEQNNSSNNLSLERPDLLKNINTKQSTENWYYRPSWTKKDAYPSPATDAQRTMLLMDEQEILEILAEQLQKEGHEVVRVYQASAFGKTATGRIDFNPANFADYVPLMEMLRTDGLLPDRIIVGWLLDDEKNKQSQDWVGFEQQQEKGFYGLNMLVQAANQLITANNLTIHILSTGLFALDDASRLSTAKSPVIGLIKCIDREFFNISCHGIDVLLPDDKNGWQVRKLMQSITAEILSGSKEKLVVLRGTEKWYRQYQPVLLNTQEPIARLKEKGVYLITGGSGNLGMFLCNHLVSNYGATVILVSRRSSLDASKLAQINQWLELDGRVEYVSADVGEEGQLLQIRESILQQYGTLNGIFHFAADITEQSFFTIDKFSLEGSRLNFIPKIKGVMNLKKVFGTDALDFMLLASSQSAILGGLGNCAYAAANIYLDHWAAYQEQSVAFPVMCINWDLWLADAQLGYNVVSNKSTSIEILLHNVAIKASEGMQVIETVLSAGLPQVIVSTSDFNVRVAYTNTRTNRTKTGNTVTRTKLPGDYVAPRNAQELQIAAIWEEMLGIDKIGIHENFFELGGDSLLAVRMLPQLKELLQKDIPLRQIILDPTIAGISDIVFNDQTELKEEQVLQQLKRSHSRNKAVQLVCIPYAGGSAIIYQQLVQSLPDHYDVWAVNTTIYDQAAAVEQSKDNQLKTLAERCVAEILESGIHKLSLYGHCGGAVLTIEIASLLELKGVMIEKIFLGAVLPLTEREFHFIPDPDHLEAFSNDQMYKFLVQLGGIDSNLRFENSAEIVNGFRNDAVVSWRYYQEIEQSHTYKKLQSPIIVLIGDADPLMNDYYNRYKHWERFSEEVQLEIIEGGGHYFIKDKAAEVSEIINKYIKQKLTAV